MVELLEFDSQHFGCRIGRWAGGDLSAAIADARAQGLDCLYVLVDATDDRSIATACDQALRLVDVRVELSLRVAAGRAIQDDAVSAVSPADHAELIGLAARSHLESRFFADHRFAPERAAELFRLWMRRTLDDPASVVLASRGAGLITGYIACECAADGLGRIGLLAVGADQRGRGLGGALVRAAQGWFADRQCSEVVVATHGRSATAIRVYEAAGFRVRAVRLWYHAWLSATIR